jgi:enterochelin esterase-like enzyme
MNSNLTGNIERIENFKSKFVSARNIDIWLPKNYSENQKYAVLYMHDGQMLFDSTKTWNKQEWGVDEKMNELTKYGEIRNSIIVGIWNTEFRHSEYFPQKPFENLPKKFQDSILHVGMRKEESSLFKIDICSDDYLKFIVKELKPLIDEIYSTRIDPNNTFIAGSSMGGLISMYAMCEYPNIFGGAACLSTHWVGTFDTLNNPIPHAFADYLDRNLPSEQSHKIYFDYGTATLDALYEPFQCRIDSIMKKNNYSEMNWVTLKFQGHDHSEKSWSDRLKTPLKFLLNK